MIGMSAATLYVCHYFVPHFLYCVVGDREGLVLTCISYCVMNITGRNTFELEE